MQEAECWTCNPEDPSSTPTLTASWICFTENLSFKSSATLVNSQLVYLRPVGILNPVIFNLYIDLIYSMPWDELFLLHQCEAKAGEFFLVRVLRLIKLIVFSYIL